MIYVTEQQVVVTSVLVIIVALVALFLGMWWGVGRGLEQAAEEQRWERERRHVIELFETAERDGRLGRTAPSETWTSAIAPWLPADETVLNPTAVPPPDTSPEDVLWTGEIQKMTAQFQQDMERLMGGTDEQLREITR